MKISTKAQYGLRAMCYLVGCCEKDKVYSLSDIAEAEDIPQDYLEKIMNNLRKGGLVKSRKGAKGGYQLAKKPEKISVKDVLDVVGETEGLVKCLRKDKSKCNRKNECVAKVVWKELEKSLYSTLKSIKLSKFKEK
ncbi:MAG: RrF2 family transcriptional regulator [Minisyncoccales bacterium]